VLDTAYRNVLDRSKQPNQTTEDLHVASLTVEPFLFGLSPSSGSGQAARNEVEGPQTQKRRTLRFRRSRGYAQSERKELLSS